jgi:hypothetical protein
LVLVALEVLRKQMVAKGLIRCSPQLRQLVAGSVVVVLWRGLPLTVVQVVPVVVLDGLAVRQVQARPTRVLLVVKKT